MQAVGSVAATQLCHFSLKGATDSTDMSERVCIPHYLRMMKFEFHIILTCTKCYSSFGVFFQSLKDGTQIFSVCVAQNQMTGLARGPRLSQRTLLCRPADASLACTCTCAESRPPPCQVRGGDRPAWDLAPRNPLDRVSPRVSHVLRAPSTLPRLP